MYFGFRSHLLYIFSIISSIAHSFLSVSVSIFTIFPPLFYRHQCVRHPNLTVVWFQQGNGPCRPFFPQWASEWSLCPHMRSVGPALPTLLIAGDVLDSVQLTSKGSQIHHCPKRNLWRPDRCSTRVKQSDFVQPLNLSPNVLDTSVWAAQHGPVISIVKEKIMQILHRQTSINQLLCLLNGHPCTTHSSLQLYLLLANQKY